MPNESSLRAANSALPPTAPSTPNPRAHVGHGRGHQMDTSVMSGLVTPLTASPQQQSFLGSAGGEGSTSRGISPIVKATTTANSRVVSAATSTAQTPVRGGVGLSSPLPRAVGAAIRSSPKRSTGKGGSPSTTPPRPRSSTGVGTHGSGATPPSDPFRSFAGASNGVPMLSIAHPRAKSRSGSGLFGPRKESIYSVDASTNTDEAGGADCIVHVQRAFIDTIWAPSRQILLDGRDRDLWTILKPLEVHLRQTVMDGYFLPMRSLMMEDEERRRQHYIDMEEERRQLLQALEQHLRLVALPTYHDLTKRAQEIEGVRREIRDMLRLH